MSRKLVIAAVHNYLQIAHSHFSFKGRYELEDYINCHPEIRFNLKGKTIGQCCYREDGIFLRFSPEAIEKYLDHMLQDTVPHEVAHLVTRVIYGNVSPHGREWKYVMYHVFNVNPSRCHNLQMSSGKRTQKFKYTCSCGQTHILGKKRHNKINKGSVYKCLDCKTPIQYTGETWKD